MRTNTRPWDYNRKRYPRLTKAQAERNEQIHRWVMDLMAFYKRGLLTMGEFQMLVDRGPSA